MGISTFDCAIYPGTKEYAAAASGLRLRSRDKLKFGLLYLNNGAWNGGQIVPEKWVEASVRPHIPIREGVTAYGYQFWLSNDTIQQQPLHTAVCIGNGDQRIFMDKARKLVIVVTAGNYNKWNIENGATELARKYIYPALVANSDR